MRNLILTGLLCGSMVVGASAVFAEGPQLSEQEMIEAPMQVEQSSSSSTPARQNQPQLLSESDLDEITAAGPFMLPNFSMMLPLLGTHPGNPGLPPQQQNPGLPPRTNTLPPQQQNPQLPPRTNTLGSHPTLGGLGQHGELGQLGTLGQH